MSKTFTTIIVLVCFAVCSLNFGVFASEQTDAKNDWGKAGPPPQIARPAAPPASTRSSIELRDPIDIPPVPLNSSVTLTPIAPTDLPTLKGANGPLPPIRLEASYIEPTTLRDVLSVALNKSLPIKISQAEMQAKRFRVLEAIGILLPSMAMGYDRNQVWTGGVGPATAVSGSFYNVIYMPVFNGGQDAFRFLRNLHESKAAKYVSSATTNDVLLDVFNKYQDLLLQHALLQVRVKAVEVSNTQVRQNEDRKAAGEGTIFEVLQSQTRLAQDQQLLLKQQVAFRKAALKLAVAINVSPAVNLLPRETILSETQLMDPKLTIADLLTLAIDSRPELKQYEQLRLAARRRIQESLGTLYPNSKFFLATNTQSKGDSNSSGIIIPAGNALSGGLISTGSGGGGTAFSAGFILNWLLPGFGVSALGDSLAFREDARKTTLKANELFLQILEEVRASYIDVLSTKEEIDVSHRAVISAREEFRVADERVRFGVGTNLERLEAQRDYFEALSRQAETIVNYRKAQAQLLRAVGSISIASLTEDKRPLRIR